MSAIRNAILVALIIATATAGWVNWKLHQPLPAPTVDLHVPATLQLDGGTAPVVPHPSQGGFVVQDGDGSVLATQAADSAQPIASVAKTMTAFVVLESHPLPSGDGPVLTMTAADVESWRQTVAEDGSNFPVSAGEKLSERDLLLALMLPSANNIAATLGRWIDGTESNFVDHLNRRALSLGMVSTHFADASGFNSATVSTPSDLVRLAAAAIQVPGFLDIVGTAHATLSNGAHLDNLDIELGADQGWLGIKTGWTPQAGGCLLFAARRSLDGGQPVTVVGAALGQPPLASGDPAHPELGEAFSSARAAVDAAFAGEVTVDPSTLPLPVTGQVFTAWGEGSALTVTPPPPARITVRRGTAVALTAARVGGQPAAAGSPVAAVTGQSAGISLTWTVTTRSAISQPSWWWHLVH